MIITHNNHLPDLIKFISKGSGEGGGSEIDSMADTLKTIAIHKLVDNNWAPNEKIYRVLSKILRPACARVFCYQQPNNNEMEELIKVKIGSFDYSAGLHQNDSIEKVFRQEEEKICEVSQDTDELFVHTTKFWCI